jgi:hypothetical protein
MAVYFKTNDPQKLLSSFKDKIKAGNIVTWSCDSDGDFTHAVPQWKNLAWLRPKFEADRLVLRILCPKGTKLSSETYAIYHGRFIETMLAHCDSLFSEGTASAMPQDGDIVSA